MVDGGDAIPVVVGTAGFEQFGTQDQVVGGVHIADACRPTLVVKPDLREDRQTDRQPTPTDLTGGRY